ncbi:unnamed protein product [Closterium sp. Naga37s-1]|nr:unnamed protein product [Closterium sp. Naga37s-1]
MDPSSVADNTLPSDDPSQPTDAPSADAVTTITPELETQESAVAPATNAPNTAGPSLADDPNWWGNHLPASTAPYNSDEEHGVFSDDNAKIEQPSVDDDPAPTESTPAPSATTQTTRRTGASSTPRWTRDEEWELALVRTELNARLMANAGQQGRGWYATLHEELLHCHPDWRHDPPSIKSKLHRMRDTYRRWVERSNRSGASRPRSIPPWVYRQHRQPAYPEHVYCTATCCRATYGPYGRATACPHCRTTSCPYAYASSPFSNAPGSHCC